MENYEIEKYQSDFSQRLSELKIAIDLDSVLRKAQSIEEESSLPQFYDDVKHSQDVLKQLKRCKDIILTAKALDDSLEELDLYYEMRKSGEGEYNDELTELVTKIENQLTSFELEMLLSHEYDMCDAIVELHAGSGGTESMDWTEMLFRMYSRYIERHGFKMTVMDILEGEEAGYKTITFMVSGPYAYGYFKGEQGVHRLIRISPFDSNARRHTSFSACHVTPIIEDASQDIEIKAEDLRVDTYRSSGAGGQYINKTESAIRITHIPTGIVVACQTQRSQIQNREVAMSMLKSKLMQLKHEEQMKKLHDITGDVSENGFGSQIRTYTLQPYQQVKDHRTNYVDGSPANVLDGDLDGFINAYLKSPYNSD